MDWLVDWLVGRLGGDVYRDLDKLMDRRKRGITWGGTWERVVLYVVVWDLFYTGVCFAECMYSGMDMEVGLGSGGFLNAE